MSPSFGGVISNPGSHHMEIRMIVTIKRGLTTGKRIRRRKIGYAVESPRDGMSSTPRHRALIDRLDRRMFGCSQL